MSVFFNFISPEGASLLSDGGVWAKQTRELIGVASKVYTAPTVPFAVVGRGCSKLTQVFAEWLCENAEKNGAAKTIDHLQRLAHLINDQYGLRYENDGALLFITAFVPGVGGVQRLFQTFPRPVFAGASRQRVDLPPYEVWTPDGENYQSGLQITGAELVAHGLAQRLNESPGRYVRRCGADIFEIARKRSTGLAGFCELTSIDANGCRREILREWPDVVVERAKAA